MLKGFNMPNEDAFIHSYCRIAGVGEATARSAYIMFDALHSDSQTPSPSQVAKVHASTASRKFPANRTGFKPA